MVSDTGENEIIERGKEGTTTVVIFISIKTKAAQHYPSSTTARILSDQSCVVIALREMLIIVLNNEGRSCWMDRWASESAVVTRLDIH